MYVGPQPFFDRRLMLVATKNATQTLCGAPVRDRTKAVSVSGIVGGIFALIAYVLRMVSRLPHFGGTLGWDDAAMTFVVVLVAPLTCLSVVCECPGGRSAKLKTNIPRSGKPWSGQGYLDNPI